MLGLAFNASSATIEQEVQNVIDDTQIRQESICDAALFRLPCLSCTYTKEIKYVIFLSDLNNQQLRCFQSQ